MNRYQMHPQSNQPTIAQPIDKSNVGSRSAESKEDLLSPSKSFKEFGEPSQDETHSDVNICDAKLADPTESMAFLGEKDEDEDNSLNHHYTCDDDIVRKPSFITTVESATTGNGQRSTLQGTNASIYSQHPGLFSANSTGDISGPMDIEGDSEFWNTVNMNHRKDGGNEAQLSLQTVPEAEEYVSSAVVSSTAGDTALSVEVRVMISTIIVEFAFNLLSCSTC